MKRLKINHILILLITFALIFSLFQFSFIINLKQTNSETKLNPKLLEVKKFQAIKEAKFSNKILVINKTEFLIPLDSNLNPQLIDLLPFNQQIFYFNKFKKIYVIEKNFPYENQSSEGNKFLSIEHENRFIGSDKLLPVTKIRGIHKKNIFSYQPKAKNKFKCLNSNQFIPYEQLNDNFCDCVDGTDEPGTNACQFGFFYCDTQNELLFDYRIPSYKVNDKICDCCDGSDEKEEIKCKNFCSGLIFDKKKEIDLKTKGLSEKKKYLAEGILKDEKLYGPKGVFYRISRFCFEIFLSKYTFKVCPYKEVLQIDSNKHVNIGRDPQLIRKRIGEWSLKMNNGESTNCPQARSSEINFKCGIKDEIISVQEPQKCVYVFVLSTPAVC
ncbi:glucosidase 2 subunit beta-like [Brachionus plicatilis]|uniref:Glucosidase 2 subunit beta n=1 Tax=Brachionus plicatilis TaxID=10195 RepID=A0A3M7S3Q0_BRAPC|nr:glucosidase 2 subunit beta-like [Brachionus plicatilis]